MHNMPRLSFQVFLVAPSALLLSSYSHLGTPRDVVKAAEPAPLRKAAAGAGLGGPGKHGTGISLGLRDSFDQSSYPPLKSFFLDIV